LAGFEEGGVTCKNLLVISLRFVSGNPAQHIFALWKFNNVVYFANFLSIAQNINFFVIILFIFVINEMSIM